MCPIGTTTFPRNTLRDPFEVVECVGPVGSAIIFDTNSPHRIEAVENSLRSTIEILYTRGNHIVKPENKIDLSVIQNAPVRELLSGLIS